MYNIRFNGCITPILLIAFIIFLMFKLWYLIVIVILLAFSWSFINKCNKKIEVKNKEKEINYQPKKGEVYKICPYCGINIKRSVSLCPNCNNKIE